jgi:hypothetical protein
VIHRVLHVKLPGNRGDPSEDREDDHRADKGIIEPVIDLPAMQCDIERRRGDGDESDAEAVIDSPFAFAALRSAVNCCLS